MDAQNSHRSGWDFVATNEAAAALIDVALKLDPSEAVTRSELAGRTDVTLKRLYLDETVTDLLEAGVFETVEDDAEGQTQYVRNEDSEVLAAAERFDRTLTERLAD